MALIQEILVPLLAVNDTTLTVVEIPLAAGSGVRKGDLIMVFETSKTTYDVEAPADGYIQYLCEADRDYSVNEVVARIFSEAAEAAAVPAAAVPAATPVAVPRQRPATIPIVRATAASSANGHGVEMATSPDPARYWDGETVFSYEADALIASSGMDRTVFKGKDFVSVSDVMNFLKPAAAPVAAPAAVLAAQATAKQSVDPEKVIVERL
jgi:pyruvate/2-oxoglutarate dehydrogenase complex dihydrolipoamide acyltransferase (E2) component